jgi:hypothetical protein
MTPSDDMAGACRSERRSAQRRPPSSGRAPRDRRQRRSGERVR